ncbi:MAG: hypothetical protein HY694_00935 [Deltaproteobacteria bacterium]|nr:hypothetical protein [Deltaproteobacteria bacterium]
MPREIGKLTPEQLAKEREARAAREEIFRRICVEVEATGSTFEQAACQLGVPPPILEYFQTDREKVKAAWTKSLDPKLKDHVPWRERLSSFGSRFIQSVKSHWTTVMAFAAVLVMLGFGTLLASLFRYEIRTTEHVGIVIRLDRFTGKVEWCRPIRGCSSYP